MQKIGILFLTLFMAIQLQAQKHEIRLKLETGHEYVQNMHSKATISQSVMGQQMTISTINTSSLVYKVLEAGNGYYDMEVSYRSLSMEMEMPMMGSMKYSSDNVTDDEPISQLFKEMIGISFAMRLSTGGKILSIDDMDDIFAPVMESDKIPMAQRQDFKNQLQQAYGEEGLRSTLENLIAVMPQSPVAIGDSWQHHNRVVNNMTLDVHSTFTLKEKTNDWYLISSTAVVQSADKDKPLSTQGMNMFFDLTGNTISEIKLDVRTGWITEATMNQEITGEAFVEASEMLPEGMAIPMHILTQITITGK